MKLKRFTQVALVLGTAFGSTAAIAGPAEAATCGAGYLCLYVDKNFYGSMGQFRQDNANLALIPKTGGGTWNDVASSARNNGTTGRTVTLYRDKGYYTGGTSPVCIGKGYTVANLTTYGLNDAASSIFWKFGC
jgi:Peptidase inhibitor family I36